jgi:hypothetical protein
MAVGEHENPWVEHVRNYARDHNMTYFCALSQPECKTSYKKPARAKAVRKDKKPMVTGREAYASMPTMEVYRKAKVIVPDARPPKIVQGSSYDRKKMSDTDKARLKARRKGGASTDSASKAFERSLASFNSGT